MPFGQPENEIACQRVLSQLKDLSHHDRELVMGTLLVQTLRAALASDVLAEFVGDALELRAVAMLLVGHNSMRVLGAATPASDHDVQIDRIMESTVAAMNEIAAKEGASGPPFAVLPR